MGSACSGGKNKVKQPLLIVDSNATLIIPNYTNFVVTQDQNTAKEAKAMLLSCMDFRLLDDIVVFMNALGYHNNYDQYILAGSSLGANQEKFPEWTASWLKHLDLAILLHNIKEVIAIDHECCGAYKIFYPNMKPEQEFQYHVCQLMKFREYMTNLYPELVLRTFYMYVDGTVEEVTQQKINDAHALYLNYEETSQEVVKQKLDQLTSHREHHDLNTVKSQQ